MKKHLPLISGSILLILTIFFSIAFDDKLHANQEDETTISVPALVNENTNQTDTTEQQFYQVVKIIDGDTFDVEIDGVTTRIRPIGINTPEMNDSRDDVRCLAIKAKEKAGELLFGRNVRLMADPTQDDLDKYGRSLRFVWREDGLFFNEVMIREGYAYEYTYDVPYLYTDEFKEAQDQAKELGVGLWSEEVCSN
jgi:micrococcal nuclease